MKLYSTHLLHRRAFAASDGEIGHCADLLLDDRDWAVRYLVVDTGNWLPGRKVVLSPLEIARHGPIAPDGLIQTKLSRAQIENSPSLDEHAPVSRQLEGQLAAYYGWPAYWEGGSLWGDTAVLPTAPRPTQESQEASPGLIEGLESDNHLRSAEELGHYMNHGTDGEFGYVKEFLFDPEHWQAHFGVLKTTRWFGGRTVAFPIQWITRIDVADKTVHTQQSCERIKSCPDVDTSQILDRAATDELFGHFGEASTGTTPPESP